MGGHRCRAAPCPPEAPHIVHRPSEYIKLFIESELKKDNIFSEVRYDSLINDELRFYVINKKEYANISYSFYKDLISKGKFKKVKDAAIIDANTCLKYFHL